MKKKLLLAITLFCLSQLAIANIVSLNQLHISASGRAFIDGSGPASGVWVQYRAGDTVIAEVQTDSNGNFSISANYSGNETVELVFVGYSVILMLKTYPPCYVLA